MSRKSRKREREAERESHNPFATPRVFRPPLINPYDFVESLVEIEDRRLYHPLDFFRPARQLSGHPVQPVNVNKARPQKARPFFKLAVPTGVRFADPKHTAVCVRRHQRKQVMIAKRQRGKGTRKRTNWYSKVSC